VLVAAGCGGTRARAFTVTGAGYSFSAPGGWAVHRSSRQLEAAERKGSVALIEVSRFALIRAFRPQLWTKAVKELDGVARRLADQQHGTVSASSDVTVASLRARRYDVAYSLDSRQVVETLVFVLRGKTEYQLLCRYERGKSSSACSLLLRSFRLT
jgi:hypothetical protein